MNELTALLIGTFSTLLGFAGTQIANYYWIKSPRLSFRLKAVSITKNPFFDEDIINMNCKIMVLNFSKNEAYNFNIISIKINNEGKYSNVGSIKVGTPPVTDSSPGEICFSVDKVGTVNTASNRYSISDEDKVFKGTVTINYSYQNQLGKKYKETFKGEMQNSGSTFFTF